MLYHGVVKIRHTRLHAARHEHAIADHEDPRRQPRFELPSDLRVERVESVEILTLRPPCRRFIGRAHAPAPHAQEGVPLEIKEGELIKPRWLHAERMRRIAGTGTRPIYKADKSARPPGLCHRRPEEQRT